MKGIVSLAEIKALFGGDKKLILLLTAGAALILFLAFGTAKPKEAEKSDGGYSAEQQSAYEAGLEKRLSGILSGIEGVGEIRVMVTLDTSQQTEYGKNEGMLLSVKMPKIRGVIVVCGGGDNVIVQEKIIRAVSGVFGISSARVSVIK